MLIAVVMVINATGFFGWNLFALSSTPPPGGQPNKGGVINKNNYGYVLAGEFTVANIKNGYQEVTVDVQMSYYPLVLVEKGIPVKLNLRATDRNINGCNGSIIIPKFGIQKDLQVGDNIIEFTPDESGNITLSCWMSMIRSNIVVVDDIGAYNGSISKPAENTVDNGGMPCCQ